MYRQDGGSRCVMLYACVVHQTREYSFCGSYTCILCTIWNNMRRRHFLCQGWPDHTHEDVFFVWMAGDAAISFEYLKYLTKVPRFQMVNMFMSNADKQGIPVPNRPFTQTFLFSPEGTYTCNLKSLLQWCTLTNPVCPYCHYSPKINCGNELWTQPSYSHFFYIVQLSVQEVWSTVRTFRWIAQL